MSETSLSPEDRAREKINDNLDTAGWTRINHTPTSETGYVEEYRFDSDERADYVLFILGDPFAVIEAKREKRAPNAALEQACRYARQIETDTVYQGQYGVPFVFASNGEEIHFRDLREDAPTERELIAFHTPEGLKEILDTNYSTAKTWLREHPPTETDPSLWTHQSECVKAIESEWQMNKNKALIQMATGSGKTRMAAAEAYRLLKAGLVRRLLFIPDTTNLVKQAYAEFASYETPDGRQLSEEYTITKLEEDDDTVLESEIVVTTLQKMYSLIEKRDDHNFHPHQFDLIITDECHRAIYNDYGIVLNTFDALELGLTATPSKRTIARFGKVAYKYGYIQGVKDKRVVPYELHRIRTRITMEGVRDEDNQNIIYPPSALGVSVTVPDTHRKIADELRETTDDELVLVFAKNDKHADHIVRDFREGAYSDKPEEYVQKITTYADKPEERLARFKDPYDEPHIAVTVDMVSTGVDIKPLENIVLLRPVRSPILYNQMMGRGTRTYDDKDRFVIYDCVGASEYFSDTPPFNTTDFVQEIGESGGKGKKDGKSDEIEVVHDVDQIIESELFFPTSDGEYLNPGEYRTRFQEFVMSRIDADGPIKSIVDSTTRVDREIIAEAESFLKDQPEFFTQSRLQRAYQTHTAHTFDFIQAAASDSEVSSPEDRVNSALREVELIFDLSTEEREWLDRMRTTYEAEGQITKEHFRYPPLSDYGGWKSARKVFGDETRLREAIFRVEVLMHNV